MTYRVAGTNGNDMSTVLRTALVIAVLSLALTRGARAQRRDLPLSHWQHTKWTGRAGPPVSNAFLVIESPDGYLWMGARNCLIRFDGVRFTVIDSTHSPVLQPRETGIFAPMFVDRQGRMWIYGPGGVRLTYANGVFEHVLTLDPADTSPGDPANPSRGDDQGPIWFKNRKPQRYENGRMVPMPIPAEAAQADIFAIEADRNGGLFIGTRDDGIWHVLRSGQVRRYGTGSMRLLIQSRDGTLWAVGAAVGGTARLDQGRWMPLRSPLDGSQLTGHTAAEDADGAIWFATRGQGILRYHRGVVEQFTTIDGLTDNDVLDIFADFRNVVWVSTRSGVDRFRYPTFTSLDPGGEVTPEIKTRYAFDESGGVWVVEALGSDVLLLENGMIGDGSRPLTAKRFKLAGGERFAVMTQSRRGVWLSGNASGIVHFRNDGSQVPVGRQAGVPLEQRTDALETSDGALWFAFLRGGVGRLADGKYRAVSIGGAEKPFIHALAEDRRGRVWIAWGYEGKIAVVAGDSVVATVAVPPDVTISTITPEHGDTLWATTNRSVLRIIGTTVAEVRVPDLEKGGGSSDIDIAEGWVWLAGRYGIARFSLADLHAAADGDSINVRLQRFDELDGLEIPRTPPTSVVYSTTVRPDGRVWINTAAGLVVTTSPPPRAVSETPTLLIEETMVDGKLLATGSRIAPRPGRVDIHFTVTGVELAERARLQYRLEGEDRDWVDATIPRIATYSKLDPAHYVFRVRALNDEGVPIASEASQRFSVAPSWNQTWWYRALMIALIAATAATIAIQWQRRRHQLAAEILRSQYEATLAERSRIAQDLHDTLLQGFAGVTMQLKAAELALPSQPTVAVQTIQRIQRVALESLREARERVWDMREVELGADDVCSALEMFTRDRVAGSGIKVEVLITGERRRLSRSLEDAAFRIGREAVTNSVKHANPRRIEIHFDFAPDVFRLEVHDDGRGIQPNEADDARRNGHFGLTGIRDRVAHAGGRCEVAQRAGGGTVVAIELPLGMR